jgi:hypothetical protein
VTGDGIVDSKDVMTLLAKWNPKSDYFSDQYFVQTD